MLTIFRPNEPISPYTSRTIVISIGANRVAYTIFEAMLQKHDNLRSRLEQTQTGSPIELPDVDEDVGHTLIHFLYTGVYHTLGLGGVAEHAKAAAEFKRSVLAYFAARLCGIRNLEELTKSKMAQYSKHMSVFEIQDVVAQIAGRLPDNEVWFPEHLYRWIKDILQKNDELVSDEKLLGLIGKSPLFDKAIVRSMAELYSEKAAALKLFPQTPVEAGNVRQHFEGEEHTGRLF